MAIDAILRRVDRSRKTIFSHHFKGCEEWKKCKMSDKKKDKKSEKYKSNIIKGILKNLNKM